MPDAGGKLFATPFAATLRVTLDPRNSRFFFLEKIEPDATAYPLHIRGIRGGCVVMGCVSAEDTAFVSVFVSNVFANSDDRQEQTSLSIIKSDSSAYHRGVDGQVSTDQSFAVKTCRTTYMTARNGPG